MSRGSLTAESGARVRILEAVLAAVIEGDADALNMAGVARRAGVSRQAVYLHFPNRAALGVAAVQWLDEREDIEAAVAPIVAATTADDALRAYAEFLGDVNPRIAPFGRMGYRMRTMPEMEEAWQDRLTARRSGALAIAKQIHDAGRLKAPFSAQTAGDFLCGLASVLRWEELTQDLRWSKKRYVEHLHAAMLGTLLAAKPRQ